MYKKNFIHEKNASRDSSNSQSSIASSDPETILDIRKKIKELFKKEEGTLSLF